MGAGPTGVLVWHSGWSVGILAHHIWSFAGDADRADFDQTYLQPFIAYTTPQAWTFTLQSESTYDWETGEWLAPINLMVAKIVNVWGSAGQQHWRRALLGPLSPRRSPWFRRPARDDLPVSGAMIGMISDRDIKREQAPTRERHAIMSDASKQEDWTRVISASGPCR